jgi:hypothetical protein
MLTIIVKRWPADRCFARIIGKNWLSVFFAENHWETLAS